MTVIQQNESKIERNKAQDVNRSKNRMMRSASRCPPFIPIPISNDYGSEEVCYATNQHAFPIPGFQLQSNFLTCEESQKIVELLDVRSSSDEDLSKGWEMCGFTSSSRQPKREQFFFRKKASQELASFEDNWGWLLDKLVNFFKQNHHHDHSKKENYQSLPHCDKCSYAASNVLLDHLRWSGELQIHATETNGASPDTDRFEDQREKCCFVAELSLLSHAVLSFQRPSENNNDTWELYGPHTHTKVLATQNSLLLRSSEFLQHWRSHVSSEHQHGHKNDKVGVILPAEFGGGRLIRDETYRRISVKIRVFHYFMEEELSSSPTSISPSIGGHFCQPLAAMVYSPSCHNGTCSNDSIHSIEEPGNIVEPLEDLLTIVITTSPIVSNPCTEMIEKVFATFQFAGHDFATKCPKVIICDGHRILDANKKSNGENVVTRKHANSKQALRNGIATEQQAENYAEFKCRLRKLCTADNEDRNPLFANTKVVELAERHGYGFALREAVRFHVHTPYVCVIQHDRTFMRSTPVTETVQAMRNHPSILKYVGFSMRSNLMYRDIFMSKYGRRSYDTLNKEMVQRPKELLLPAKIYGRDGQSCQEMLEGLRSVELVENLLSFQKTYLAAESYTAHQKWELDQLQHDAEHSKGENALTQLSLIPTLFWYDNIHITETSHYRDFVYNDKFKMVAKGSFVEDKLTQVMIRQVEKLGLVEGHRLFGCYLLDDHSGFFFTGHLDGGRYMSETARNAFLSNKMASMVKED